MQEKEPERSCIACRHKGTKDEFLKIVMSKSGEVQIEKDKKLDGRGAYICKNINCANLAKKSKSLSRVFKRNIPIEIYEEILNEFTTGKN